MKSANPPRLITFCGEGGSASNWLSGWTKKNSQNSQMIQSSTGDRSEVVVEVDEATRAVSASRADRMAAPSFWPAHGPATERTGAHCVDTVHDARRPAKADHP